ncbi:MAG TPA: T9SS type A sorting domain-containing protein, partial [Flavobacterium sp.]|nr:T9SS type A sorting domain-containing protein [Flavobacterium sp.]
TLQATTTSGVLRWYNVATGGAILGTGPFFPTPSISSTTTFYVEAFDGGCLSPRTAVVATVNETPTIVSTSPATRCGSGTLTLGASASSGNLSWYNVATGGAPIGTGPAFTTPSLSSTTTYYVEATNGSCVSAREVVVATITTLPTITSTAAAARCDAGTLTLQATASSGTLSWYTVSSGGSAVGTGTSFTTPVISATTTYYAEATNGSCTSARTAVVATINVTPSIVSVTPASRCGTGSVTLSAVANAGTISWYVAASGGSVLGTGATFTTPSIASTTTYYAEATNGSCVSVRTAVVATINTQPDVASVSGASRCDTGSVTLAATATSGILHWYAQASGGSELGSGVSFITPSLATTTTFYVEAVNGSCISTRVPVTATITQTPIITSTVPASRCDAGSVTLGATASGGMISWYDAAVGGTELANGQTYTTTTLSATTTYWVEVANGDCVSMRLPVTATVNETPTVVTTVPGARCDTGSVTLQATASGGSLNWYNVATGGTSIGSGAVFQTPSISATTAFYVEAVNGSCISPRVAVLATVTGTPSVTATTPASRCGTGSVTLGATASSGTITWYDQAFGGAALATGATFTTPSVSNTTTFYVEAHNGTCVSNRVPVVATITAVPNVVSSTGGIRCGTGTVVLSAAASAGTLNWYNVASGGTILGSGGTFTTPPIAATTTFYVEASNGSCTSARTAVLATVNTEAAITSIIPGSRCGVGTVNLSATGDGTVNWFDQPSGGTVLATGSLFTTPEIGASTTYYVEVTNGSCTSVRVPVLATVTVSPEVVATTAADRCGTGTMVLEAVASTGSLNWYNQPIGGLLLGTGTSFTTPAIAATTTFYVEAVNGNCVSARIPVTATVNPLGVVTGVTPGSRCGAGSVTLSASGTGTLNWFASATGGSALGTGTTFETPSLSATATYYVEATNGICVSTRSPVTAEVTVIPTPTGNVTQTFCEGETVAMLVVEGNAIVWYNALEGGSIVAGETPLVAGTTYYAAQSEGACESDVRLAVTVTNGACLGVDQPDEAVMKLYPNPVADVVTIESPLDIRAVELVTMLGQRVMYLQTQGTQAKVDMSSLAAATYFLQVMTDEGVKTYKVVKR